MTMDLNTDNKQVYTGYADKIFDKRFNSVNPLRRYAHQAQYQSVINQIPAGSSVIDVGCGEGVLSCLLAAKGFKVTGVDLSEPNIVAANKLAKEMGVENNVTFAVGDAENVAFPDKSFDVVVSSHVLEHLPHFDKGLAEVFRLAKSEAIIALPTIANLCSLIQAGRGSFWEFSPRSLIALLRGFVLALVHLGGEGVDEGYGGNRDLTHIWRYPWVVKNKLQHPDFKIAVTEASTLALPFFLFWLPLIKIMDRYRRKPVLKYCGYGTTVVLKRL